MTYLNTMSAWGKSLLAWRYFGQNGLFFCLLWPVAFCRQWRSVAVFLEGHFRTGKRICHLGVSRLPFQGKIGGFLSPAVDETL